MAGNAEENELEFNGEIEELDTLDLAPLQGLRSHLEKSKLIMERAFQDFEDSEMTWKARYQDCSTSQASSSTPSSSYVQEQDRKVELSQCTHSPQGIPPSVAVNHLHCSDCLFEERRQRLNSSTETEISEGRKFLSFETEVLQLRRFSREVLNRTNEMFKWMWNPHQSNSRSSSCPSHSDAARRSLSDLSPLDLLKMTMPGKKASPLHVRARGSEKSRRIHEEMIHEIPSPLHVRARGSEKSRRIHEEMIHEIRAMWRPRRDFSFALPSCAQPSSPSMHSSSGSAEEEEGKKIEKNHVSALDSLPDMAKALPSAVECEPGDSLRTRLRNLEWSLMTRRFNRDSPDFMSMMRTVRNQQVLDERRSFSRFKINQERRQLDTEE